MNPTKMELIEEKRRLSESNLCCIGSQNSQCRSPVFGTLGHSKHSIWGESLEHSGQPDRHIAASAEQQKLQLPFLPNER